MRIPYGMWRHKVTRILTDEEIERLEWETRMDYCGLMVRLSLRMGLHQNEIIALRVADFDEDSGRLRIGGPNARDVIVLEDLRLPIIRANQGRGGDAFIVSSRPDGLRRLGARSFQAYLTRIAARLSIEGLSFHNLRATCIVRHLEAGRDPRLLQRYFGVRTRKSITKYLEFMREPCVALMAAPTRSGAPPANRVRREAVS